MTSYIISQYVMKKHTNVFMPWYFFIKYVKWPLETLISQVVWPTNLIASIVNRESLWGYYLWKFILSDSRTAICFSWYYALQYAAINMILHLRGFIYFSQYPFVQETNRYECPCLTNKPLRGESQQIHTCTCNYSCKYWCNFYYKP